MNNNELIPLYALDHDLTYDLLYAENIHFKILQFLASIPAFPVAYTDDKTTGLLLFERITLDGYLWSENYSLKLFEFYKKLSKWGNYRENLDPNYDPPPRQFKRFGWGSVSTNIYGDELNSFNGSFTNFTRPNPLDYLPLSFSIRNTLSKDVYISYYEDEYGFAAHINQNVVRGTIAIPYGKIYNKRTIKLKPGEKSANIQPLFCSLVCSETSINSQIPNHFSYEQLDSLLNQISSIIDNSFLLKDKYVSSINLYYTSSGHYNFTSEDIIYNQLPESHYFCALLRPGKEPLGKRIKINLDGANLRYSFNKSPSNQNLDHLNILVDQYRSRNNHSERVQILEIDFLPYWINEDSEVNLEKDEFIKAYIDTIFSRLTTTGESENDFMPDSLRLKEIHACLQADKYANQIKDGKIEPRVANLGYYIERIGRILGISVEPDGSTRSIRQSRHIKQGDKIPAGWSIGQWGRNQGGENQGQKGGKNTEDRDGLAYEVIGNRFTTNPFTGNPDKIEQGGYVLCENLPQLLEIFKDDLDKCLGLQAAGANALPSADKSTYITYEGLHTLLQELVFMASSLSSQTAQTLISSTVTQAISQEILASFGVPLDIKDFPLELGTEKLKLPYPGLSSDAPTVFSLISVVLANLGPVLASMLTIYENKDNKLNEYQKNKELEVEELHDIIGYSTKKEGD